MLNLTIQNSSNWGLSALKTTGHTTVCLGTGRRCWMINTWEGLEVQRKSFFLLEDGELKHAHLVRQECQRRRTEQINFSLYYYFPLEDWYTDGTIFYKEDYMSGKVVLSMGLFLRLCCVQRILSSCKVQL